MDFNEYSSEAVLHAFYPGRGKLTGILYAALGLAGEAGECADKVKKLLRDYHGQVSEEFRASMIKEIGDTLWYADCLARELQSSLEEVASMNLEKLGSRAARGVLGGSGDNR